MESIGFKDTSDLRPWRESFPEFADNEPGTALSGERYKEGGRNGSFQKKPASRKGTFPKWKTASGLSAGKSRIYQEP